MKDGLPVLSRADVAGDAVHGASTGANELLAEPFRDAGNVAFGRLSEF